MKLPVLGKEIASVPTTSGPESATELWLKCFFVRVLIAFCNKFSLFEELPFLSFLLLHLILVLVLFFAY